jgi:hypothetical protein
MSGTDGAPPLATGSRPTPSRATGLESTTKLHHGDDRHLTAHPWFRHFSHGIDLVSVVHLLLLDHVMYLKWIATRQIYDVEMHRPLVREAMLSSLTPPVSRALKQTLFEEMKELRRQTLRMMDRRSQVRKVCEVDEAIGRAYRTPLIHAALLDAIESFRSSHSEDAFLAAGMAGGRDGYADHADVRRPWHVSPFPPSHLSGGGGGRRGSRSSVYDREFEMLHEQYRHMEKMERAVAFEVLMNEDERKMEVRRIRSDSDSVRGVDPSSATEPHEESAREQDRLRERALAKERRRGAVDQAVQLGLVLQSMCDDCAGILRDLSAFRDRLTCRLLHVFLEDEHCVGRNLRHVHDGHTRMIDSIGLHFRQRSFLFDTKRRQFDDTVTLWHRRFITYADTTTSILSKIFMPHATDLQGWLKRCAAHPPEYLEWLATSEYVREFSDPGPRRWMSANLVRCDDMTLEQVVPARSKEDMGALAAILQAASERPEEVIPDWVRRLRRCEDDVRRWSVRDDPIPTLMARVKTWRSEYKSGAVVAAHARMYAHWLMDHHERNGRDIRQRRARASHRLGELRDLQVRVQGHRDDKASEEAQRSIATLAKEVRELNDVLVQWEAMQLQLQMWCRWSREASPPMAELDRFSRESDAISKEREDHHRKHAEDVDRARKNAAAALGEEAESMSGMTRQTVLGALGEYVEAEAGALHAFAERMGMQQTEVMKLESRLHDIHREATSDIRITGDLRHLTSLLGPTTLSEAYPMHFGVMMGQFSYYDAERLFERLRFYATFMEAECTTWEHHLKTATERSFSAPSASSFSSSSTASSSSSRSSSSTAPSAPGRPLPPSLPGPQPWPHPHLSIPAHAPTLPSPHPHTHHSYPHPALHPAAPSSYSFSVPGPAPAPVFTPVPTAAPVSPAPVVPHAASWFPPAPSPATAAATALPLHLYPPLMTAVSTQPQGVYPSSS